MLLVNWEHPGFAFSQKIEVTRRENEESLMVASYSSFSFNLFLSSPYSRSGSLPLMFDRFSWLLWEIFLLSFLSMKHCCCFGWVGSLPQMLIWAWSSCFSLFLLLQIDEEEKVGVLVSLSMKDLWCR